jgi:2-polyprenyl-3-methyl-5-hydroxy-6-metoxy-1,4-benzoquinol methylase
MPTLSKPLIIDQKRFWETWNPTLRDPDSLNEWCKRRAETILQLLQSLNLDRPKIIDLGCGTGWLSGILADFGPTTGVDLAETVIAKAKSRFPHVTFLSGDIFKMSLPVNHFDVVVSQEVIAHVVDQAAYVDRAAHLLKPGGHLIITTANKFIIDRGDFPPQPPEHIENWLTMRKLKHLISPNFKVLRSMTIIPIGHRGILRFVNSSKVNTLLRMVISQRHLETVKERIGLGYTMILLAQKTD